MHDWDNCVVRNAGVAADNDHVLVCIHTAAMGPNPRWYYADPSFRREILSIALTALSTEQTVGVRVDDPAENQRIVRFYLNRA